MTIRLYYDDARLVRFHATVSAIAGEGRVVYLDRTAFYPTSGGQPHDLGTVAGVAVTDVVDEETQIAHHLAAPVRVTEGDAVVGEIDATRRFDHMQQHTGQHLLSALLHDHYGWPTVSVHFGAETSTVDLATGDAPVVPLAEIEARINALVVARHAVTVSYESAADAHGLRKASERDGTLRIVTIAGLDRSACGGTHVADTAEIGVVLLRRAERMKGNTRVEFVCGHRAVRCARTDLELLTRAARPLSAAAADLPMLVEQQLIRLGELERERRRLQEALARHEADARWRATPPSADGLRRIVLPAAGPVKEMEPLVQQLLALGGCIVLVTETTTGTATGMASTVLAATAADTGVDAGAVLRATLQAVGGRGGGSARIAQGTVPDRSALASVYAAFGIPGGH